MTPDDNPIVRAIKARRSIRKYLDKPVPEGIIQKILDAAAMSPSAINSQHWRFIVVEDRGMILKLSGRVKKQIGLLGYGVRVAEIARSREDGIFHGAPLLIIVSAPKDDKWSEINCGIVAQTMFLAAHSYGLGSCFIGFANTLNDDKEALGELAIPNGYKIIAPLVFGYPGEEKPSPKREPRVVKWVKQEQAKK